MEEEKETKMKTAPLELLLSHYGPYAFGVVSLLIIWFTIVSPELKNRQIDYDKHSTIVNQQAQIAETMKATSVTMQTTATVMESTTQILSRTVERMDKLEDAQ